MKKMAKNEWENDDSDFLPSSYNAYKKLGQFFFHTLLANLFKQKQNSFEQLFRHFGAVA